MRVVVLCVMVFCLPLVIAQEGHIDLLALVENGDNRSGALVDLFLEVKPGRERVFLETVPLTKITTQVSLRFAQAIACQELQAPCEQYDFLYTIRGFPGVVGGPSAGAAATVLAISVLANVPLEDGVAITGTINSGGIIGPVGGVKEKIGAAARNGIHTVLIPRGNAAGVDGAGNVSIDLVEYGKSLGIDVVEVGTLRDALPYFGRFDLPQVSDEFVVSDGFNAKLKEVADELCGRAGVLMGEVRNASEIVGNLSQYSSQSLDEGNYYAAASYCFRSNVLLRQEWYVQQDLSRDEVEAAARELAVQAEQFEAEVNARELSTLTDLQVYMSVDERLSEAKELIQQVLDEGDVSALGYARERLESARSWATFFDGEDRAYVVDEARLRESCADKIAEAEERYSYVSEFVNSGLRSMRAELDEVYGMLNSGQYVRCLYSASRMKAEIDSLLGLIGVDDAQELIEEKIRATRVSLQRAQEKGVFPIIGYNYLQYAQSLRDVDVHSALLFAEYALEFSALDIYFDRREVARGVESDAVWGVGATQGFVVGLGAGILFTMIYLAVAVGYVRRESARVQKNGRRKKR